MRFSAIINTESSRKRNCQPPPAGVEEVVLQGKQVLGAARSQGVRRKEEEEKAVAGRSNSERGKWGTQIQMHKQMRSGSGSRDRVEGVEHNYTITNNIFATDEVSTTLVRSSSQPAMLLLHSSQQVEGLSWRHVHKPVMTWYMILWYVISWPCCQPSEGKKYQTIKDSSI